MTDKKPKSGQGSTERFGNKGHRLIAPETKPAQRPKPQSPKPDKK